MGKKMRLASPLRIQAKEALRKRVLQLEDEVSKLPQVHCPIRHYFSPGIYAREMTVPAGTVVTGAVHKTEHFIVISKGRVLMASDFGAQEFAAPHMLRCMPGMKNAFCTLDDTVWTNFLSNPTNERDTDKLVEIFSESTAAELLGGSQNRQLLENKRQEAEAAGQISAAPT